MRIRWSYHGLGSCVNDDLRIAIYVRLSMRDHMIRVRAALLAGALFIVGCAGAGFPDVNDGHDLSTAFGPPSISRIRDAGSVRLPQTGHWKGDPDGVAVPGELLVIE